MIQDRFNTEEAGDCSNVCSLGGMEGKICGCGSESGEDDIVDKQREVDARLVERGSKSGKPA